MHLHDGRLDGGNSIAQGNGGVRVTTGVEDDALVGKACFVQLVNQIPLMVALKIVQNNAGEVLLQFLKIFLEGTLAVDMRLTGTQQVQVWAVDYQ